MKVAFKLIALLIATALPLSSADGQTCKQEKLGGTIKAGEDFIRPIGPSLELRVVSKAKGMTARGDWGWDISIGPHGSSDDWSSVVNLPISGEAQNLGTGWAMTVDAALSEKHSLHFVLTKADYDYYWKLAFHPKSDTDTTFYQKVETIDDTKMGSILLTPLDYETDGSPETVKWLRFTVRVQVPKSFHTDGAAWRIVPCSRVGNPEVSTARKLDPDLP